MGTAGLANRDKDATAPGYRLDTPVSGSLAQAAIAQSPANPRDFLDLHLTEIEKSLLGETQWRRGRDSNSQHAQANAERRSDASRANPFGGILGSKR